MHTIWSILLFIVTMSLSQHLGDLTGKKFMMPNHTGKIIGIIFAGILMIEHKVGIIF